MDLRKQTSDGNGCGAQRGVPVSRKESALLISTYLVSWGHLHGVLQAGYLQAPWLCSVKLCVSQSPLKLLLCSAVIREMTGLGDRLTTPTYEPPTTTTFRN